MAIALLGLVSFHQAQAALIAYEGFDYTPDTDLSGQNGGSGWANPWSVATGDSNVLGSLSYVDGSGNTLNTTGNSGYFTALAGAANVQSRRTNTFVRNDASGTTWVSFIAAYGGNDLNRAAGFQLHTNTSERISVGKGTTNVVAPGTWSILRGGSVATSVFTTNVITNITFHVLRIDHHVDANDDIYLFENPSLNSEPATGAASASYIGEAEFSFNAVRVFAAYSGGNYADYYLDEIRMGDTYTDVTPYTPSGGGGIQPRITQIQVVGGSVSLTVTGAPSTSYTILMATNVTDAITNVLGTASATDGSGAGGAFTDPTPVTSQPRRYYRARDQVLLE